MEIRYEREMRHNYLIIKPESLKRENYECRMLMANSIDGLLKFRFRQTEDGMEYYYEITSRQPLNRLLEGKYIQRNEIVELISAIGSVLDHLESYLLQENQLLLEPQYIYVDPDTFQIEFCLVPDRDVPFAGALEALLQFILKKVDHSEKNSVLLAYRLYQESQKEQYGIEDLLKWLPQEERLAQTRSGETIFPEAEGKSEREEGNLPVREEGRQKFEIKESLTTQRIRQRGYRLFIWKRLGIGMGIVIAPGIVWLLEGTGFLMRHRLWVAVWYLSGGIVLAGIVIIHVLKKRRRNECNGDTVRHSWDVEFSEPEPVRRTPDQGDFPKTELGDQGNREREMLEEVFDALAPEAAKEVSFSKTGAVKAEKPAIFETRILVPDNSGQKAGHYLISLDKMVEDIPISYFPFIIGKQSGIVDYALEKDTVSRIHVKLEGKEGDYRITDLNSTNGTRVGNKVLQNNETVSLKEGDEIYIADIGFRFM